MITAGKLTGRAVGICRECGREMRIAGHGLCQRCWWLEWARARPGYCRDTGRRRLPPLEDLPQFWRSTRPGQKGAVPVAQPGLPNRVPLLPRASDLIEVAQLGANGGLVGVEHERRPAWTCAFCGHGNLSHAKVFYPHSGLRCLVGHSESVTVVSICDCVIVRTENGWQGTTKRIAISRFLAAPFWLELSCAAASSR